MKRITSFILVLLIIISFSSCSLSSESEDKDFWAFLKSISPFDNAYSDPVIDSLPPYNNKEFYTSGGFQDYTDYAKYTFDEISVEDFELSEYFSVVTSDDIAELYSYMDNFENWVDEIGNELKENYDFNRKTITEGDFVYIKIKHNDPDEDLNYRKFDFYSIYLYDSETEVLYYFHNNI